MKPVPHPAHWVAGLLAWLHPLETLKEVEGDLAELYPIGTNIVLIKIKD
jgi:hypothetical protein